MFRIKSLDPKLLERFNKVMLNKIKGFFSKKNSSIYIFRLVSDAILKGIMVVYRSDYINIMKFSILTSFFRITSINSLKKKLFY